LGQANFPGRKKTKLFCIFGFTEKTKQVEWARYAIMGKKNNSGGPGTATNYAFHAEDEIFHHILEGGVLRTFKIGGGGGRAGTVFPAYVGFQKFVGISQRRATFHAWTGKKFVRNASECAFCRDLSFRPRWTGRRRALTPQRLVACRLEGAT